jgi:hypothetical protein
MNMNQRRDRKEPACGLTGTDAFPYKLRQVVNDSSLGLIEVKFSVGKYIHTLPRLLCYARE